MKMFALIKMVGGQPDIPVTTPYFGFVLCDTAGQWGAYLISGTGAQLTAINNLSSVVGICVYGNLDENVDAGVRTTLNNWITNNRPAWPTIPAGITNRQLLRALYRRFNDKYEIETMDISD